ncbi:MAG: peptide chain release factor N(5)-glutamine methyltransferase [Acetobacteraceae bacterium]|nr:peptide chain release factor N(5)-glutamine methyltransferase [Acetobacteraceae bacterium]MDW8399228.1 peptide chain release factor N(5)-glutamine methyltransferase [Acetobacteraceae bacterium]
MSPTVGALLCQGGAALRAAGIEDARAEARRLLAHALPATPEALLRDRHAPVAPEAEARFRALLSRRAAREPLAFITGRAGFWTLDLEVSPDTLIPRADSETLIEAALAARPDRGAVRRILDLGTGTGALLLAALAEYPAAFGVGVDRSAAAAALAARNAARNGLAGRAAFLVGDWAGALSGRFDLVLANPPYIPAGEIPGLMPEVARHEPASALSGGPDGLAAYRAILPALPALLEEAGFAVLEVGIGQAEAVESLGRGAGLAPAGRRNDLGGVARAVMFRRPRNFPVGGPAHRG